MRVAERDAHVNAVRAEHETTAATDLPTAARHRQLAGIWRALEAKAAQEAEMFAAVQDTRREWDAVTEPTRRIAIAADLELRRRHPGTRIEPLQPHPSEAAGITGTEQPSPDRDEVWIQDTLDGSPGLAEGTTPARQHAPSADDRSEAAGQREAAGQLALGLTPETARDQIPEQVLRIRENASIAQAKLDELARTPLPGAQEDDPSPGPAWPISVGQDRDAVLQPPKPEVVPSARVLEHHAAQTVAEHGDAERG